MKVKIMKTHSNNCPISVMILTWERFIVLSSDTFVCVQKDGVQILVQ